MNQKVKVGIIGFGLHGWILFGGDAEERSMGGTLHLRYGPRGTRFGKEKVADIPNRSG